jgi:tRNA A-37 threonylcarbamoyl transferase component Bud32
MTPTSHHPPPDTLKAYLQGRLPLEEAARLDRHIESCESCARALERVGSDTFCELLRQTETQIQVDPSPFSPSTLPSGLPTALLNHPRYEIGECLGRGGMGVVYRARHRMMHRDVALKVIRPDLLASPEAVERFRREVRLAAQLAHPHIVAAYDAEEIDGVHVLVMEYVEGKTLDAIVQKRGALSVAAACTLARQVALGLDHAHARSMIHRDIKPLNLMLVEKSKVKILDFGLARWQGGSDSPESSTKEGQVLGTMMYAAPEQRQSAATVTARADQYSLGATLRYLLTAELPDGKRDWPEAIPQGVRDLVNRLMADSPDDRYPSMKAVADALAPWTGRKSLADGTTSVRGKRMWWAAAILLVTVFIGIGVILISRGGTDKPTPPTHSTPPIRPNTISREWQSLLDFNPADHTVVGDWRLVNGELHVAPGRATRIAIPGTVPAEYDLRVTFTRHSGRHSVGVIVVQNGHPVVFELDAWEQHLGGFQNIAGLTIVDNPTRHAAVRIINNRRYTMRVEVRRHQIQGYWDDRSIALYRTDGSDLSIDRNTWVMPGPPGFGLVAWQSNVTFHSMEILTR